MCQDNNKHAQTSRSGFDYDTRLLNPNQERIQILKFTLQFTSNVAFKAVHIKTKEAAIDVFILNLSYFNVSKLI